MFVGKVKSFQDTLRHLVKSEGLRGLTKGFSLNIIKGPITMGISLSTYDFLRKWLKDIGYLAAQEKNYPEKNSK